MARILWHGIGPWHKTAYGLQTALFVPRLAGLGHEVVIAIMGEHKGERNPLNHPDAARTKRTGRWQDHPVIGPGLTEFGLPPARKIRDAFGGHDPDLVLVLKDAWVLDAKGYDRWTTAVWCNIDCQPMGYHDARFFRESGTIPIATSKFGLSMMRKAGLKDARYIPHGIDTGFWTPGDKAEARELLSLPPDAFIAGINAANIGPRKAWGEQFKAFALERNTGRRDSLLLVHAAAEHPEGVNLRELAYHLGLNESPERPMISDAVRFGSNSNMADDQMRSWYRSLDVLLAATYGEGFGVPIVEAHACGIPVIGTDHSAMPEKIPPGTGWLVPGQEWWNPHHQAWWKIPNIKAISAKLGQPAGKPDLIAQSAQPYDADLITKEHWAPLIDELCG